MRLGKKAAFLDHRVPPMAARLNIPALPPPPPSANWYAAIPAGGIQLLGNDKFGCCVEASACHFISEMSTYLTPSAPLIATTDECLKIYSDVAGWNPNNPATDVGSLVMGPDGLMQAWLRDGIVVGGRRSKLASVATVDFRDRDQLKHAVSLFGFVFTGASISQAVMDSDFLWEATTSQIIGGHEFLVCGYETILTETRWDIMTWNGMFRATDDWITQNVDESAVVIDPAAFDAMGVNAAHVSMAELQQDMEVIRSA